MNTFSLWKKATPGLRTNGHGDNPQVVQPVERITGNTLEDAIKKFVFMMLGQGHTLEYICGVTDDGTYFTCKIDTNIVGPTFFLEGPTIGQ